jgi:asparagine synthase (glutamine-hydrolysing)
MTSVTGGIAGWITFNGRPVTGEEAASLVNATPHRGPAGSDMVHVEAGVLVTLYLCREEQKKRPSEPVTAVKYTAVIHGTIHNEDQLRSILGGRSTPAPLTTEELVIAAYKRWGDRCPDYLVGDYSFAIWDAEKQELFCARDAVGIKPLYYFYGEGVFLFGSEIDQVATFPGARRHIDYSHILSFSQDRPNCRETTFFTGIKRLPAAHSMRVSSAGIHQFRYWNPVALPALELDSPEEYENAFEDIFTEAIRVRMPQAGEKLGVLLSGGVDSASVVAGIRQISGDIGHSDRLLALSLGFAELPCDETRTIRANAKVLGVNVHLHQHTPLTGPRIREAIGQSLATPESVIAIAYGELFKYAQKNRITVVMGGWGADDWLGTWQGSYRDLLTSGHFRQLAHAVNRGLLGNGLRSTLRELVMECIRDPLARQIKRWAMTSRLPLFTERANHVRELDKADWKFISHWNQYRWLNSPMFALNCEMQELCAARQGIDARYPYNDRRIVEFGMRLPPHIVAGSATNKPLIRDFLARRVPDLDARCYSDPEGSPIYWQTLRKLYTDGDFDLSPLKRKYQLDSQWANKLTAPLDNPVYQAETMPHLVRKMWSSYTYGVWLDDFFRRHGDIQDYAQRHSDTTIAGSKPEA